MPGMYFCHSHVAGAGLLQQHVIPREREGRSCDLLLAVFVPVREPGQATDSHNDDRVAGVQRHLRRGIGNRDVDPVAAAHGRDCRCVRRVQTGLQRPVPRHFAHLLGSELGTLDAAVACSGEHAVRQREAEENVGSGVNVLDLHISETSFLNLLQILLMLFAATSLL